MPTEVDIGALCGASRRRLSSLVRDTGDDGCRLRAVAACPGWSVHDTIAHLLGVVEDGLAGLLSGPPDEAMTAREVSRHRDHSVEEMVMAWERLAPMFETVLTERQIWPAMLDVISHEHDVRAALGTPGARDDSAVLLGARRLAELDTTRVVITVEEFSDIASPRCPSAEATLTAPAFEILRFRLGRRSVGQVLDLPWIGDPRPHLPALFVFGPASHSLIE